MSKVNPLRSLIQPVIDTAQKVTGGNTATRPAGSSNRDAFTSPAPESAARRLGFGIPGTDIDIGLPDLPSIDDIKDALGGLFDKLKDEIIERGADALFDALEALPGDIGNEELRRLQDLGQVKAPERHLTADERASLEAVYGDSIDYDKVVVREGDIGLFNRDDRPLVLGNTILVPEGRLDDDTGAIRPDDLIHEAAHLWQFQHGGIDYIKESVVDQGQEGSGAYEFEDDVLAGKPWDELGPEQQAHLIESAYEQGYFDENGGGRFEINGQDATAYLREALRNVHAGRGAPGGPPAFE